MLNAMTPPQGPHHQASSSTDSALLLAQQQQREQHQLGKQHESQQEQQSQDQTPPPPENSSSPISSASSTISSSASSQLSSTNLLVTIAPSTKQDSQAIGTHGSSENHHLEDIKRSTTNDHDATSVAQTIHEHPIAELQQQPQLQQLDADDHNHGEQTTTEVRVSEQEAIGEDLTSTHGDDSSHPATTTSQDNGSNEQTTSPGNTNDNGDDGTLAGATTQSQSIQQTASTVSPATSNSTQYQHQQNQHSTITHHKSNAYHSQAYSSSNNSRFTGHNSHHSNSNNNHHHHNNSHNSHNSTNSINRSTTTNNSATFSTMRSSNHRGHNSSRRHNKSHHQHNQQAQHSNHHQQQHQHHQQSAVMSNGGLSRERKQHQQQHLPTPYSTLATATSSASPATSLSGSDSAARNSTSSISRSAAPTSAGPPHYVEMHVYAGECVAFQLMDGQEQVIAGPATMTMVSQQESPPVPIPVQVPPGHMIHQVADENGTLKHIIFSVMDCEDNAHIDSNVINFPHETFRVDSLGELVSTSNSSIGVDCDSSSCEQQATSPSSKSNSASSDKISPSNHYKTADRQDAFNVNNSATIASANSASSYRSPKETYKFGNDKQASYHNASHKNESSELGDDDIAKSSVQDPAYEMAGHNVGMMQEVPPDMDPNMLANSGQQMLPSVDEQMYGYPTCACCCCYCDPSAEAAAAAVAAATAVGTGQPPHPSAQLSTGAMIPPHDSMMMQPLPASQSLQHEAPTSGGGPRPGRGTIGMSYHQANQMIAGTGQQSQAFQNHHHLGSGNMADMTNSMNGNKTHVNKNHRGLHSFKQHGNKSHQTRYDRHHNSYNQYNHNQPAYNSVVSTNGTPNYPSDVNAGMGYKTSQLQTGVAQAYQPIYSNYDNHSADYARMTNQISSDISKSASSSQIASSTSSSATSYHRVNQGAYNTAANRTYRNEHQPTGTAGIINNEIAPTKKQQHQLQPQNNPTNDKNVSGRFSSYSRAINNSHVSPSNSIGGGKNQSASSGSLSPMRLTKSNKGQNKSESLHNDQTNGQSSSESKKPAPTNNSNQDQVVKESVSQATVAEQSKQNSSGRNPVVSLEKALTDYQPEQATNEQQPIVSKNIPVAPSQDVSEDCNLIKSPHQQEDQQLKINEETSQDQQVRQQSINAIQRAEQTSPVNKSEGNIKDESQLVALPTNRTPKQSTKVSTVESSSRHQSQQSKKHVIDASKRSQDVPVGLSMQEVPRSSRIKQKKVQKEDNVRQRQPQQADSVTRGTDLISNTIRRGSNTAPSHQISSGHPNGSSKHHHTHNQPIKVMSVFKQCRNRLTASLGRAVQYSLSSYSDTKFAGLLLIIFTMFATLLAFLIDYYIVAPVIE